MNNFFLEVILPIIIIMVIACGIAYYSAYRQAQIFNTKYQATYTAGDFLWAGSQINQQVQIIKIEGIK